MTANVDIVTSKVKNTLYIPREAVRRDGNIFYSMILYDSNPKRVEIEVGIQTPIYSEVISGIEYEQDAVVGDWEKLIADSKKNSGKGSSLKKILWMIRSK